MSSTTALARPTSGYSSPSTFSNKGGYTNGPSQENFAPQWNRGAIRNRSHQFSKKVPKVKHSGKWSPSQTYYKRPKNYSPKPNKLLDRLSPQSPSGTLLQRIGTSALDVGASLADRIDMDQVDDFEESVDTYADLPDDPIPHFYTPEPGEVERFLESVPIGTPPPPPPPPSSTSCSIEPRKPTLALKTHNLLPLHHRIKVEEDIPASVLYSPTITAVNSLSSIAAYPPDQESPLLGDMPPLSASTLEECRKSLVPILLSATKARDPSKDPDAEQCLRLLSDDQCTQFLGQAKEMRRQLLSLISQQTPMYQGWNGSQKYGRVDEKGSWNRGGTRSRFNSMNTVVSDPGVSRRDSEITLVDFPGGKSPPKAPRAMLHSYAKNDNWKGDYPPSPTDHAHVSSPTTEEPPSSASLIDLAREAIRMFPALVSATPSTTEMDTSEGQPLGDQSTEQSLPPVPATMPRFEDFISHLPTQPGVWFSQQGKRNAEIVNIDIDVSEDLFVIARESRLFRMKMNVRLCSVPGGGMTNDSGKEDVDAFIGSDTMHWPRKGTLVVQVNPDSEQGRTWLPYTLESSPLDVTSCMVPGKNTFRFIQLSDLSDFTFVLIVSPPSPEEEWRSWDWTSVFDRSRMKPYAEDELSGTLSKFAHISVTIRS